MTKGSFTRDRRWDLRDDFDVLFAMQDVVNEFVENNFLQKKHNIIRDRFAQLWNADVYYNNRVRIKL